MQAGDRLGEYVLLKKIGEGGFGEVWKAHNPDLAGSTVAIKVPTKGDCVAALRREGAMQHAVVHPNVVRTISINTANDPPYLVNEYVPGESLRGRLARTGRVPTEEAIHILSQVLSALSAAHAAGLVHRDVKPENVLLGPDGVAKLSDFGLGKITESVAASIALSGGRSLTEGGGIVGTYHYMSPEQMKGQPAGPQSDLYACGVILYEMLTGEPHPVRLPIDGRRSPLSDVVDVALRSHPNERYSAADQMLSDLDEWRPGCIAPAQAVPVVATPSRAGTGGGLVAGCAAAVLVAVGMAALMTTKRSAAMRESEEAARDRQMAEVTAAAQASASRSKPIESLPDGKWPSWTEEIKNGDAYLARRQFSLALSAYQDGILNAELDVDSPAEAKAIVRDACYATARALSILSTGAGRAENERRLESSEKETYHANAFKMLDRARSLGWCDAAAAQAEPDFAPIRSDPRWRKLLDSLCR